MSDLTEPGDGSYVAVQRSYDPPQMLVYRRDDSQAGSRNTSDERWFCKDERSGRVMTWGALTMTGPVALVGEFVDRRAS